ncbi:hypothetical protein C8R45DRAFT_991667 [Mycena sanguinolenta]|nr:hypothetical protein C8R45DRAFT_991667 [Mycena sanguinolenta]
MISECLIFSLSLLWFRGAGGKWWGRVLRRGGRRQCRIPALFGHSPLSGRPTLHAISFGAQTGCEEGGGSRLSFQGYISPFPLVVIAFPGTTTRFRIIISACVCLWIPLPSPFFLPSRAPLSSFGFFSLRFLFSFFIPLLA